MGTEKHTQDDDSEPGPEAEGNCEHREQRIEAPDDREWEKDEHGKPEGEESENENSGHDVFLWLVNGREYSNAGNAKVGSPLTRDSHTIGIRHRWLVIF